MWSSQQVAGTVLRTICNNSLQFKRLSTLYGTYRYSFHFTDQEAEDKKGEIICLIKVTHSW